MRVLLVFAERRGLPTPHDAPRTTKTTQPTTSSECPSRRKIGKRNHPLDSKMATSRVIDGVTAAPRSAARRPHLSPRIRERRRARTPRSRPCGPQDAGAPRLQAQTPNKQPSAATTRTLTTRRRRPRPKQAASCFLNLVKQRSTTARRDSSIRTPRAPSKKPHAP